MCDAKAELVLDSKPDDAFLNAHCSVCPRTKFHLEGNLLSDKLLLKQMFEIHVKRFHHVEDADDTDSRRIS